jgi:hypothetical protein
MQTQVLDFINQVVPAWFTVPAAIALFVGVLAVSLIASRMREIWR